MVNDPGPFSSSYWDWNNPAVPALSSLVGFLLGFLLPAWSSGITDMCFLAQQALFFGLLVLIVIVCHDSEVLNLIEHNHGLWLV